MRRYMRSLAFILVLFMAWPPSMANKKKGRTPRRQAVESAVDSAAQRRRPKPRSPQISRMTSRDFLPPHTRQPLERSSLPRNNTQARQIFRDIMQVSLIRLEYVKVIENGQIYLEVYRDLSMRLGGPVPSLKVHLEMYRDLLMDLLKRDTRFQRTENAEISQVAARNIVLEVMVALRFARLSIFDILSEALKRNDGVFPRERLREMEGGFQRFDMDLKRFLLDVFSHETGLESSYRSRIEAMQRTNQEAFDALIDLLNHMTVDFAGVGTFEFENSQGVRQNALRAESDLHNLELSLQSSTQTLSRIVTQLSLQRNSTRRPRRINRDIESLFEDLESSHHLLLDFIVEYL